MWVALPWLLLLIGAAAFSQSASPNITTDQLEVVTRASKVETPVVIDVRSWVEYQDSHIPGAIHIPSDSISARLLEKVRNKNRELIFYCGGPRCPNSREAADEAKELGYRNVRVYQDGLAAWQKADQRTESSGSLPVFDPTFVSPEEIMPVVEKKTKDTIIVDVRSRKEYAAFHLQNSVNIPLDELEDRSKRLSKKKIIFVCHAGGQSIVAARLLSKTGKKDMCVLRGGLAEWQRTHLPYLEGQIR